jgi:hypothetical protein
MSEEQPSPTYGRIAVNLTPRGSTALATIVAHSGDNITDAVISSLRSTATLLGLAHPDGTVHVQAPDQTVHIVHLF